jgi:uncharacterized protein (DUF1684 family)
MASLAYTTDPDPHAFGASDALDLLDWKRRIFDLYDRVRSCADPEEAWNLWREVREELYRTHPQSPVPAGTRAAYGNAFFPYDSRYRVFADVTDADPRPSAIPASTGGSFAFSRMGIAQFDLLGRGHELEVLWNEGYGGGILVAVADTTTGSDTYAGGRYVLDTVKGADLGNDGNRVVLDFNFAFNPSCAFDSRWSCPLAPATNRLPVPLRVGERAPG